MSSSLTHTPVSSQPPQFWQGKMFVRFRLHRWTLNPESSIPFIASFRRSSVLPPSLGLPRNAIVFIDYPIFLNIFLGAPHIGHLSGGSPSTVFPQTWHT